MRAALVAVLALATGTAVARGWLIALCRLAALHLVRSIVKTTHGRLVCSHAHGGLLLMVADAGTVGHGAADCPWRADRRCWAALPVVPDAQGQATWAEGR